MATRQEDPLSFLDDSEVQRARDTARSLGDDPLAFLDDQSAPGGADPSDPLSFLDRTEPESEDQGGFFTGVGGGLLQSAGGLVGLPGMVIPGKDPFERGGEALREKGEELGEASGAGELTGRIVGEGAQLVAGGAGVAKLGGKLLAKAGGRFARSAVRIRQGLEAVQRAGATVPLGARARRLASESLIFSPVDAAIGLQRSDADPELDPVEAITEELVLGAGGGAVFEAAAATVRPIARRFHKTTRTLREAVRKRRPLTESETREVLKDPLHPSGAKLRGDAPSGGSGSVPLRPLSDFLLNPSNPILTRAGGPLTEGDRVLLFSRGDLTDASIRFAPSPRGAPGDGPLVAEEFEVFSPLVRAIGRGETVGNSLSTGRRFVLPEPGEGFAEALQRAIELEGLQGIPRGPRVLRRRGDFEIDADLGGLPRLVDDAGHIAAQAREMPENVRQQLFRGDETTKDPSMLRASARDRFRRLTLPTKRQLAQRAPELYHVTTAADEILAMQEPLLVAQGRGLSRGSLQGGREPAVSFTTSRAEAVMLKRELLRAGRLVRGEFAVENLADLRELFEGFARQDAGAAGLSRELAEELLARARRVGSSDRQVDLNNPRELLREFQEYLSRRDDLARRVDVEFTDREVGHLLDPALSPEPNSYVGATEHSVGIVAKATRDLPEDAALVRRWQDPLSEVAVHADVGAADAKFIGPLRQPPESKKPGLGRKASSEGELEELSLEELADRAGLEATRSVLREIHQINPELLERMRASGELPLDPEDFKGFTKNSPERLLAEEGSSLDQQVKERLLEVMADVADSDPRFAGRPKSGRTVDEVEEAALKQRSIEELATEERLTTPSLVAARNMLRGSVKRLETLHRAASHAMGTSRERIDMLISREHAASRLLLKLVGSDISEAGLRLRMFREYAEAQQQLNPRFWLNEARRRLGDSAFKARKGEITEEINRLIGKEDRRGLARLMGKLEVPPLGERLVLLWKAGLLTNPKTHAVNLTSNLSFAAMERLVEEPAAFFDYVLSLEPVARRLGLGDLPRTTFSPSRAKELRSLRRGGKLGKELAEHVLTGERPQGELAARLSEIKATLENQKIDLSGREVSFKLFTDPDFLEALATGAGPRATVSAFAHTYVNSIFKALGSADMAFKGAAIDGSIVRQAQAMAEGTERSAKDLLGNWMQNPRSIPDEVLLNSILEANVRTFQDQTKLGKVFGTMQQLPGVGQFIVPFSRVMGSLLTRTLEYAGWGVGKGLLGLRKAARQSEEALEGGARGDRSLSELLSDAPDVTKAIRQRRSAVKQLARGFTGPGIMAAGYLLADQGLLIGSLPEIGTSEREVAMAAGLQERSLYVPREIAEKVGLPGGWFDASRIAPGGQVLALGAQMHQQINDPDSTDLMRMLTPFVGALNLIAEQPFAQGLRRVARASEDPVSATRAFLLGLASSFVPVASAGVGAIARTTDPTVREDEGMVFFRFLNRIPWVKETRPARLNVFGEPIERTPGVVANLMLPGRLRKETDHPVVREMARVGAGVPRVQRKTLTVQEDGRDVQKQEELADFQRRQKLVGQASLRAAEAAVNSFTYKRAIPALSEHSPLDEEALRREYIEQRIDDVRRMLFRSGLGAPQDAGSDAQAELIVRELLTE